MLSFFFFASRRRHTRWPRDWSSDVCSSDLVQHRTPDLYRSVVAHVGVETSLTRGCAGRPGSVRGARTPLVHKSRVSLGRSEERRVGKSVALGGGRMIRKKGQIQARGDMYRV